MPLKVLKEEDINEETDCAVCKDSFSVGDEVLVIPCEHMFHPDCIKPWLKEHCSCPVCRYKLPSED